MGVPRLALLTVTCCAKLKVHATFHHDLHVGVGFFKSFSSEAVKRGSRICKAVRAERGRYYYSATVVHTLRLLHCKPCSIAQIVSSVTQVTF